ncbi:MAG: hypothetical protein CHACPFDD_01096 [Phycisphaerae bacterium]|nr:hypothetical protein [Phycisphaerae bacterium]
MLSFDGISNTFRFTVVQVAKQLELTRRLLDHPEPRLIKRIRTADDYIDTQKNMIESQCFSLLRRSTAVDKQMVNTLRALNTITINLERIADFSVNIARRVESMRESALLRKFDHRPYFEPLIAAAGRIVDALFERDATAALSICHADAELDRLYKQDFSQVIEELRAGRDAEQLVGVLLVFHYLERMGDSMLNIGEAILFAIIGERVKYSQYRALQQSLASSTVEERIEEIEIEGFWGTRSGCRIGTVHERAARSGERVVYKQGNFEKLRAEQESIERWERIAPGLVPRVMEFHRDDADATLLLEYVDGSTFQELLLSAEPAVLDRALELIESTLRRLWCSTRRPEPNPSDFLAQLASRIDDVYTVHPQFRTPDIEISSVHVARLEDMLSAAQDVERELPAPFRVFIHGDLNIDNIIYDHLRHKLHFIDLHRSGEADYVQDASVFAVSVFRLPLFVRKVRRRLDGAATQFVGWVRDFARSQHDATFDARLALGLIRSFVTSTRFEFSRRFSKTMFLRATYLLERLLAHRGNAWENFSLPDEILVY